MDKVFLQLSETLVVDSSVFIKIFIEEHDSVIARKLISQVNKSDSFIIIPSIFEYEIISAIKRSKLPFEFLYPIIKDQIKASFKIINLEEKIIRKAFEISNIGNIKSGFPSFYDAVYHALAIINNCDFITADKKYYDKTKNCGHICLLENY